MALQKTKLTEYGVSANYWRVFSVSMNRNDHSSIVAVGLYKDKTTRDQTPTPIPLQIVHFVYPGLYLISGSLQNVESPFTVEAMDDTNVYELAYESLKTLDVFSGASDV